MTYPKIQLKFWWKNGKTTSYPATDKTKRLYYRLRHGKYLKVFIKVQYGYQKDVYGERVMFQNSGTYQNKKEAIGALQAFLEG